MSDSVFEMKVLFLTQMYSFAFRHSNLKRFNAHTHSHTHSDPVEQVLGSGETVCERVRKKRNPQGVSRSQVKVPPGYTCRKSGDSGIGSEKTKQNTHTHTHTHTDELAGETPCIQGVSTLYLTGHLDMETLFHCFSDTETLVSMAPVRR